MTHPVTLKRALSWTMTILFLLGTNVNPVVANGNQSALEKAEAAAHAAGMTDAEIAKEEKLAHEAHLTADDLAKGAHNAKMDNKTLEETLDSLHNAEAHKANHNANHNANQGMTESQMVEEAHKAGLTDQQIAHEAQMAHDAGISNNQIVEEFQHAEAAGLSGEEMLDELHNAEAHHAPAHNANNNNNGSHSAQSSLLDKAHQAGLTDDEIKHDMEIGHEAGLSNEQIVNEVQHAHQAGLTNEEIFQKIEEMGGYHPGSQFIAPPNEAKTDLSLKSSRSMGARVAYSLLGIASALLFAVFASFFYKKRSKKNDQDFSNSNMAPYKDDDEEVADIV